MWNSVSSSPLIRVVGGQADAGGGLAGTRIPQLSIAGSVAIQDDVVDAAHPSIIPVMCKNSV
jgi:hypothetical protein